MQTALKLNKPTVMEEIKHTLQEKLKESEYQRLEHSLSIIERNREIRAEFKRLRNQGFNFDVAIRKMTNQKWAGQYLSYHTIQEIVYPRKK